MLAIIVITVVVLYVILAVKIPKVALITSPVAMIVFFVLSLASEAPVAAGISFLILPAGLLSLVADKRDWTRRVVKGLFQVLGGGCLLAIAVFLWPLALLLSPVFVTIILRCLLVARNSRALYVMSTIGAAMRQNLPLATALETAAGRNTDKRARILRSISKWLVQGHSLSDAIKRGYSGCPAQAVAMITAAEEIDQVPRAIRSIEADMVEKADESKKIKPVDMAYPFIVLSCAFIIMMGLMIFIVPNFAAVLSDMSDGKTSLPAPTQFLLNFSDWLFGGRGIVLFGFVGVIISTISIATFVRFRARRPQRPYLLSRIGDFLKWHLPFLRWFEMNYSLVQVVSFLKVSLNAGCALNEAIRNSLRLDTNCFFRKRLKRWLRKVEAGDNVSSAAGKSGMGKPIAWAFDDKVNEGNTPEILGMLEEFYRSNYNFRINIAKSAAMPFMVVGLGAAVGFIVFAMFMPMFTILSVLTADVLP